MAPDTNEQDADRILTFGEEAVDVNFNPNGNERCPSLKSIMQPSSTS